MMNHADDRFHKSYDPVGWEHKELMKRLDRQNELLGQLVDILSGATLGGNSFPDRMLEIRPKPERGTPATAANNGARIW